MLFRFRQLLNSMASGSLGQLPLARKDVNLLPGVLELGGKFPGGFLQGGTLFAERFDLLLAVL